MTNTLFLFNNRTVVAKYSFFSPRLNSKQEKLLSDKLFDLANYFAVGFVISQVATEKPSIGLIFLGIAIYVLFGIIAVQFRK